MSLEKEKKIEQILLSLKKLDYLTREQVQKIVNLGQTRNAQIFLKNMEDYLSTFTEDRKKVYYLNSEGREMVQAEKVRKKTAMINHFLMRNDLFLAVGRPSSWKNEIKISVPNSKQSIVADAVYMMNKLHHFVEVDCKQSMSKNIQKINKYKEIEKHNPNFVLVWVTTTPYRKQKIKSLCEGLKVKVFQWEDIK